MNIRHSTHPSRTFEGTQSGFCWLYSHGVVFQGTVFYCTFSKLVFGFRGLIRFKDNLLGKITSWGVVWSLIRRHTMSDCLFFVMLVAVENQCNPLGIAKWFCSIIPFSFILLHNEKLFSSTLWYSLSRKRQINYLPVFKVMSWFISVILQMWPIR